MLELLLDEMISSVVSQQINQRRPEITIQSIFQWRAGTLLNKPDYLVLEAAAEDGLTLVTYDLQTIRPLIAEWAASGITHGGVVYVDEHTIQSDSFGQLIRALERLWDHECQQDWTNRTMFLDRP